jgi:hypothetical protein
MPGPEAECSALCLTESGARTRADVKWLGLPICRDHLAICQMRCEGQSVTSTFLPTVSAPEMLQ